jgi:hypothetical protein
MTSCDRLPDIVRQGGLLSLAQRRLRGIPEPENPHYWGSPGKQEELADFVICSFMAPWWMCNKRSEELAMILLDAEAIGTRPGVLFCPGNSALNVYSADQIKAMVGITAFDGCFQNTDTYQAGNAEVFVPDLIPLTEWAGIVFCDQEASDYWRPLINEAYRDTSPRPALPTRRLGIHVGSAPGFQFPGTYAPTARLRP